MEYVSAAPIGEPTVGREDKFESDVEGESRRRKSLKFVSCKWRYASSRKTFLDLASL